MRQSEETDRQIRERLVAWLRFLMEEHGIETGKEAARRLKLSAPTISTLLNGTRTPGLDFLVRLHRTFHISADVLLDSDPPTRKARSPRPSQRDSPSATTPPSKRNTGSS